MKPWHIDYLISLGICLLLFLGLFIRDKWDEHRRNYSVNWFYKTSSSINKSKESGRYLANYNLDIQHSVINRKKCTPDSIILIEKLEKSYYNTPDGVNRVTVADSIFNDSVLNNSGFRSTNSDIIREMYSIFTWVDKKNGDTLNSWNGYYIMKLKRYPDTLLIIETKDEMVYKGKICLTRE